MKPHYTQKHGLASMLFATLCSTFSAVQVAGEPPSCPPEMLADAELSDVLFLDADRGWAVGDRGDTCSPVVAARCRSSRQSLPS